MVRVKVCGITNESDATMAVELGADALGFVFADSPRRVSAEEAANICDGLPPFVSKVGVFVDEDDARVREIAARCGLDLMQFHGSETPAYCRLFGRKAVKAFRIKDAGSLAWVNKYGPGPILLDAFVEGKAGGTGLTFDWDLAGRVTGRSRIILSGGLNPGNVAEAITKVKPYAVDVSSGVESSAGRKDARKIREFIKAVRRTEELT